MQVMSRRDYFLGCQSLHEFQTTPNGVTTLRLRTSAKEPFNVGPVLAAPCSNMTVYRTNDDCDDVLWHDNKRNITLYESEYVDDGNALQLQTAGDACIVYRTHANLRLDWAACCIQSVMQWNNSI